MLSRLSPLRMRGGASVVSAVPVNSVAPVVSGTAAVASTLSCTTGTWSNSPSSYAYQWLRDGSNIGSATSSTYLLDEDDLDADISCRVTASNASGAGTPAVSNEVGPIAEEGATAPYPLYTSFDRNELPFHTASGSWGAQVPLEAPTPPTTTRQVTVTTTGQFGTEAAVAGTEITIGADFSESSLVGINASDIDVILPAGRSIGGLMLGGSGSPGCSRVRIRKAPGDTRGGRMGQFRIQPAITTPWTDVILDGIDMNGSGAYGGASEKNMCLYLDDTGLQPTRMFIHNVRGICGQALGFLQIDHLMIALCSFRASAVSRTTAERNEGWCIRGHGSPMVIVDSALETTRYHTVRPNTANAPNEYFYCARTQIVNLSESKIGWLGNKLSSPAFGYWWGAWVLDCDIYSAATATCVSDEGTDSALLSVTTTTYSRIMNNRVYSGGTGNSITWSGSNLTSERNSAISAQNANSTLEGLGRVPLPSDAHSSDADLATNTFHTLTGRPAWGGAGDPTEVPLPNGWTLDNDNDDDYGGAPTCAAVW